MSIKAEYKLTVENLALNFSTTFYSEIISNLRRIVRITLFAFILEMHKIFSQLLMLHPTIYVYR